MVAVNVRNLSDEVHPILEMAVFPPQRVKLSALMASIAQEAGGLTDEDAQNFSQLRDKTPAQPLRFV